MSDRGVVNRGHEHAKDDVLNPSEQVDIANRAADLASERYAAEERARRSESLEQLLGRGTDPRTSPDHTSV